MRKILRPAARIDAAAALLKPSRMAKRVATVKLA